MPERMDEMYDEREEVVFGGGMYFLDEPVFAMVNGSEYGTGRDYLLNVKIFHSENQNLPAGKNCFV